MSAPVITVERTATLALAEELMNVERVRHLPVVEGDVLVGMLSDRDLLAASLSTLDDPSEEDDLERKRRTEVSQVMRGSIETVTADFPAGRAAEALLEHHIGCLPVIDERRHVVGIVTSFDYVRLAKEILRDGEVNRERGPRSAGRR